MTTHITQAGMSRLQSVGAITPDLRKATGAVAGGPLPPFGWPGGYPVVYFDPEGDWLCATCATDALDDPDDTSPTGYLVYYEGEPIACAVCGTVIESAYGNPEEKEEA